MLKVITIETECVKTETDVLGGSYEVEGSRNKEVKSYEVETEKFEQFIDEEFNENDNIQNDLTGNYFGYDVKIEDYIDWHKEEFKYEDIVLKEVV